MKNTAAGVVLLVLGVISLGIIYSMRPPSGFMEAFSMMAQGRQTFIKPPVYQFLLAVSGLATLFGALLLCLGVSRRSETSGSQQTIAGGQLVGAHENVTGELDVDQLTKKCPQCAESIKLEALVCRFCGCRYDPGEVQNAIEGAKTSWRVRREREEAEARQRPTRRVFATGECECGVISFKKTPEAWTCRGCGAVYVLPKVPAEQA